MGCYNNQTNVQSYEGNLEWGGWPYQTTEVADRLLNKNKVCLEIWPEFFFMYSVYNQSYKGG